MSDKWDESLVKPLDELTTEEVGQFLESYQFFSAAFTVTYGENTEYERTYSYEDSLSEGGDWHVIEDYASNGYDLPIGHLRLVDSYGGEGKGDDYYMILGLTQGDVTRTFKMNGYHVSHDGSYYDGPFVEVKPRLKTITVWE